MLQPIIGLALCEGYAVNFFDKKSIGIRLSPGDRVANQQTTKEGKYFDYMHRQGPILRKYTGINGNRTINTNSTLYIHSGL
jgi:hypothetical protein